MNITIVAPYYSLPSEPHFNRFWYLAKLLSQSHDALLTTSNFRHYDKFFKRPEDVEVASQGRLRVILSEGSGYSKDVFLGRVTSHHRFVKYLGKWLENCCPREQDVVFSAYPLITTNLFLGKHKARLGYRLIISVQDVWPESLSSVASSLRKVPHSLLSFASCANQAYRCTDTLVTVLQIYLDRTKEANPNIPGGVVYIGADFPKLDAAPAKNFGDDKTRFFYLGMLNYSYDVETACKGIRKLLDAGEDVELHIMGGGLDLDGLKQYACGSIRSYGYIPYAEMMSVAKGCDTSVNTIHSCAMQSTINKLSDYMTLQKPILNSQVNDEIAEVLTLLPHANYRSGDVESFIKVVKDILKRRGDPIQSGEIIHCFERDVVYQKIVNLIERLTHE